MLDTMEYGNAALADTTDAAIKPAADLYCSGHSCPQCGKPCMKLVETHPPHECSSYHTW